eukprot:Blabericola_migrator_1__5516@NODE_2813_length_2325_cov_45_599646_g1763_i0_p2_GENE_NODE_2813_length_2325_cov_45_599646_g1763_i0NODE_2813_length_2325_cov_45_599646_g1763_i0_p2_ORF_typecomplete_len102_score15_28PWI/PF01480_17/0_082_NODE_2813_length_2325_cov_45_599646_g1763_i011801485
MVSLSRWCKQSVTNMLDICDTLVVWFLVSQLSNPSTARFSTSVSMPCNRFSVLMGGRRINEGDPSSDTWDDKAVKTCFPHSCCHAQLQRQLRSEPVERVVG